ncbi:MAG: AtpZ/AtpI family protein [Methyloceanibacter sp.]|uniref:AtpZ/AtpI family protein n=1 Tax=Methyloceanibacter sp. TaxID=1965321 RepID=UPI003D6D3B01
MAGAEKESGRRASGRDTQEIRQRLDALHGKLAKAQGRSGPPPEEPEGRGKAMGQALRLATEMVAGVAVGGFIGWALDQVFGTAPFLMVAFLFLGGAAGIMNVVRTAKSMQGEPMPGHHLRQKATDDDDDD